MAKKKLFMCWLFRLYVTPFWKDMHNYEKIVISLNWPIWWRQIAVALLILIIRPNLQNQTWVEIATQSDTLA